MAMQPQTAHRICPVMKLPGNTLIPCKTHMPLTGIKSTPTIFSAILIFSPRRVMHTPQNAIQAHIQSNPAWVDPPW